MTSEEVEYTHIHTYNDLDVLLFALTHYLANVYAFQLKLYILLGEGNGTPLQYSCLENPMDEGAWQAKVHGVAKSWT